VENRYPDVPVQHLLMLADTDPFYRPDAFTVSNKPFDDISISIKTVKILDYYNRLTYHNVHLEQKNITYFFVLLILESMFTKKHNQQAVFNAKKSLLEAMNRCGHIEEDIILAVLVSSFVLVLRDSHLSEKWKKEVRMQKKLGVNAVKWFVNEEAWSFKKGKAEGKAEGVVAGMMIGQILERLRIIKNLVLMGFSEQEALKFTDTSLLEYQRFLFSFEGIEAKEKKD
jgi:hypothetical protein